MNFYGRKKELESLYKIQELSATYAQMTVISGRRRIGKTTLVKKIAQGKPMIYFFVGRKSESLLCAELSEVIKSVLNVDLGEFSSISRLFSVVMSLSKERNFTLVFDEFQNFKYANESIFSDIQNVWDANKETSHIHLILCGSVQTLMSKIFDDKREPLYGRANNRIFLKPFSIETITEILRDFNPQFTPDDLLTLYMTTGGVAKYVEQMMSHGATDKESMIQEFLSTASYFIPEGKDMLNDEFGKESNNYFSILASIANGHNDRGAIKSYTEIEPGGYLERLEKSYNLIYRYRPYGSSENSQNVRYGIKDQFLKFWFRFVYKYSSAIEIGNTEYVVSKIMADYDTYSGIVLETFFRQKFSETGMYNVVTNYWEKNGGNEIDLIAVDDNEKEMVIAEVKRNPRKINLSELERKATGIVSLKKKYNVRYLALSLEDMTL